MSKPYEPTVLYRLNDKQTGECVGYIAPSREAGKFYQISIDSIGMWACDCHRGELGRHCCHVDAVSELCLIRKQRQASQQKATEQPATPAESVQPKQVEKPVEQPPVVAAKPAPRVLVPAGMTETEAALIARQTAPLNGNRGFNFFR